MVTYYFFSLHKSLSEVKYSIYQQLDIDQKKRIYFFYFLYYTGHCIPVIEITHLHDVQ